MYSFISTGTVFSSCFGFWLFNKLLDDKSMPVKVPEKYSGCDAKCKWRNVMGSILHAILVSIIGVYCFYSSPEYITDRVGTHTMIGEINICITIGYLAYDAVDLIRYQGVYSTWPILMHHLALHFLGFGCVMFHRQLVAYALCGSVIEINSIFLHGRQLLLMYGVSKNSRLYKLNNTINILTYIVLRLIGGSIMLFAFLPADYERMSYFWCIAFSLAILILLVINIVLFYRLLRSDFFSRGHRKEANIMDMLSNKQSDLNVPKTN